MRNSLATCLLAASLVQGSSAGAVKLNDPLPPGRIVTTFNLAPDGGRAVFEVGTSGLGESEVWSVPTAGGPPTPLHPPLNGGLARFSRISPDGALVAFEARFASSGPLDIHAAPIEGGSLTFLAPDPYQFRISADSQRLLFHDTTTLESVPLSGGAATVLSAPLGPGRLLVDFSEEPDGSILYEEYECFFECDLVLPKELLVVPADGGPAVSLAEVSGDMFRAVGLRAATPDGSRVVYTIDEPSASIPDGLFSVPAGGGEATRLNPLEAVSSAHVWTLAISPDGSRVVYIAQQERSLLDLYSVPVEGGPVTRLNASAGGVSSDLSRWEIVPGWDEIVYLADSAFHSAPIAGGPSRQISPTFLNAASTSLLAISPNEAWVLYRAEVTAGVVELFVVPLPGGPARKLNAPLPAGGDVAFAAFTPDSTRVVYTAEQETDGVQELWSVPTWGGMPTKLNGPLTAGGDVAEFRVTADGQRAVYVADQDVDGVRELYSSPLPPPPLPPRRCGLLGVEGVALVAVLEALRAHRRGYRLRIPARRPERRISQ